MKKLGWGAWEGGQGTLIHVRSAHQQFTEIYWVELQECKLCKPGILIHVAQYAPTVYWIYWNEPNKGV